MIRKLRLRWLRFLAYWRLQEYAICEMSKSLGEIDYHDYPDSDQGPWHFGDHYCNRCNKRFVI